MESALTRGISDRIACNSKSLFGTIPSILRNDPMEFVTCRYVGRIPLHEVFRRLVRNSGTAGIGRLRAFKSQLFGRLAKLGIEGLGKPENVA
jgi:hypothetical protein